MRITYLTMAVTAFGLSLVTGDAVPIATSSFILVASLLVAVISTGRERREG